MPFSFSSLIPTSLYTRLYILTTLFETLVDLVIEVYLLYKLQLSNHGTLLSGDDQGQRVLPVYLGIFVIAHVFQLVLAFEAVLSRNTIQVVGLTAFNAAFLIYAIIQIGEITATFSSSKVSLLVDVIPIVIGATELIYIWLTWLIYQEFGWDIYKKIGADRGVKKMFKWYQVFVVFLKFDYFFFIGFSLQLVIIVRLETAVEKYLTVAAIPLTLLLLILGFAAIRYEIRWLAWMFLAGCLMGAIYFVFKLFRIYQKRTEDYRLVFKSLTAFSAISLILLVSTSWIGAICLKNFDRGLKSHMARISQSRSKSDKMGLYEDELGIRGNHYPLESASNSRMSFD